jgi:hypothetical protein
VIKLLFEGFFMVLPTGGFCSNISHPVSAEIPVQAIASPISACLRRVGNEVFSEAASPTKEKGEGRIVSIKEVVRQILDNIQQKRQQGKPVIIFIAGPSASGKSALTSSLQQEGLIFKSIKTDHFLKSFSELSLLPQNQGLPVSAWPIVHGHEDSFNRDIANNLLQAISTGCSFNYLVPAEYREGVMVGGYLRGERDINGPSRLIEVPVGDTYLIEGICTPHLMQGREENHIFVQLDCDFNETVKRRAGRGHDGAIPAEERKKEDLGQYQAFQNAIGRLGQIVKPDIHLDSSGMSEGNFYQKDVAVSLPLKRVSNLVIPPQKSAHF